MCGRYATTKSVDQLVLEFSAVDGTGGRVAPDYNVAPTIDVPIIRLSRPRPTESSAEADPEAPRPPAQRKVSMARWGLVPYWAKDTKGAARMINARAESVATKPAFRTAFERRRALIPADGWYEWTVREHQPGKQPYYMTAPDGSTLVMAGLWEVWGHGEDRLVTCSVVTTAAVGPLADVHDRMPLLLPRDRWSSWLGEAGADAGTSDENTVDGRGSATGSGKSTDSPAPALESLLAAPSAEFLAELEIRPVGSAVGNVRNNSPALRERVSEPPVQDTLL